jgi:hypothetical protein
LQIAGPHPATGTMAKHDRAPGTADLADMRPGRAMRGVDLDDLRGVDSPIVPVSPLGVPPAAPRAPPTPSRALPPGPDSAPAHPALGQNPDLVAPAEVNPDSATYMGTKSDLVATGAASPGL